MTASGLPLFHLYGDPPDDSAFDFIHIETIASRSSVHDWTIRAHRHRNLFQILLIEKGGGEMSFETATVKFAAPAAILVPATTVHGFRFTPRVTDGWVVSFTEDVADALGDQSGEALARLKAVAAHPLVPLTGAGETKRLSALCNDLNEEASLAREGYRLAMRGLLALIAIEVVRLAVSRQRSGSVTLTRADERVEDLRRLLDEHFRKQRLISFYAEKLAMTADRLNDHVKRAAGVTGRGLNPDFVETTVAQHDTIRNAIECNAAGKAKILKFGLRCERAREAEHHFVGHRLDRGSEIHVSLR